MRIKAFKALVCSSQMGVKRISDQFAQKLARLFPPKFRQHRPHEHPLDTMWMPWDQGRDHPKTQAFCETPLFLPEVPWTRGRFRS